MSAQEAIAAMRKEPLRRVTSGLKSTDSTQRMAPDRPVQRQHDEQSLGDDSDDGASLFDQPSDRESRASVDMIDLTSDTDDEGTTVLATVFEPTVALRPACFKWHLGFKGKTPASQRQYLRPKFRTCGQYKECAHAQLYPPSAQQHIYRLQTSYPAHDLRRWLLSRNNLINGAWETRDSGVFVHDTRFTSALLRETLALAVTEIHYEHEHMRHLACYGRRYPYRVTGNLPLAPEAEGKWLEIKPDEGVANSIGFSRKGLVVELVQAADELDYLRGQSEEIAASVLERKKDLAEYGDLGEQEMLVACGFVSEDWVRENC